MSVKKQQNARNSSLTKDYNRKSIISSFNNHKNIYPFQEKSLIKIKTKESVQNEYDLDSCSIKNIDKKDMIEKIESNVDNSNLQMESLAKDSKSINNSLLIEENKINLNGQSGQSLVISNQLNQSNSSIGRVYRSKSITKKPGSFDKNSLLDSRYSRASVFTDSKSIISPQTKNQKNSFSDFGNDLHFSYRKSADPLLKKSNFGLKEEDTKLFMILKWFIF